MNNGDTHQNPTSKKYSAVASSSLDSSGQNLSERLLSTSDQILSAEMDQELKTESILKEILISVFSSSFSMLCIFLIETINLMIMGRTKNANLYLDTVGLGNIYLNFAGVLIVFGFLGAMDTMGSNCYGRKNYQLLAIYTIRTRMILCAVFLLFTVPSCLFSYKIMMSINIYESLAASSYIYIVYMMPTVFLTLNYNLNIRYLQVMQCYVYPSLISMSAMVIHFILCYVAVIILDFELVGICVCSAITMSYCLVMSTVCIAILNPCPESLVFIPPARVYNREEFWSYLKLCFYSGLQHFGDYIGYEIVCFMCSYLTQSSMATTFIVLNYANLIGYIYVGFSFPLAHMVGYSLGKKDFARYYHCLKIFTWINLITAVILGGSIFLFPHKISALYTNDLETLEKCSTIFRLWTIGVTFDIFNIMLQAIMRGAGKQFITSVLNIIMSIFWMVPVSYLLCFTFNFDVLGLWIGCISFVVITTIINLVYFIFLNVEEASTIIEKELEGEWEVDKIMKVKSRESESL